MTSLEHLHQNFIRLSIPEAATEWLLMLFNIIQVFDDIADADSIDRKDLDKAIWDSLVGMHQNSFFRSCSVSLVPVMATAILKWQASDTVEKQAKHDEVSFVWRAGYYDIVLLVVQLCNGTQFATDNAHYIMSLYGEKYDDYKKEFDYA